MAMDIIHNVVGMEETAAIKFLAAYGLTARVIQKNGECFIVIQNIDTNRVNLYIKEDKVYKVNRG